MKLTGEKFPFSHTQRLVHIEGLTLGLRCADFNALFTQLGSAY